MSGHELDYGLRLLVALVLGAVLGFEREYHEHPAGLRTMSLVAMGSCLFTLTGVALDGRNTDPTRVAAQVVAGIGFLGGGTILRYGASIKGLTTAATIWVAAAVGMVAGFGFLVLATIGTVLVLVALTAFKLVEERIFRRDPQP